MIRNDDSNWLSISCSDKALINFPAGGTEVRKANMSTDIVIEKTDIVIVTVTGIEAGMITGCLRKSWKSRRRMSWEQSLAWPRYDRKWDIHIQLLNLKLKDCAVSLSNTIGPNTKEMGLSLCYSLITSNTWFGAYWG